MIVEQLESLVVPIDSLSSLEGNPRRGDVKAVARSLKRFGQRKPIVVDGGGRVVAGNHTLAAARELGWTEIAAVRVDEDDATAKAYALADNRTSALGAFDGRALLAMIGEVEAADPDLLLAASFDEGELRRLRHEQRGGTDADDLPPAPDPVAELGDVWQLGAHRLACGSATDGELVDRLLAGTEIALIATDPPYGVDYSTIVESRENQRRYGWAPIEGDADPVKAAELAGAAIAAVRERASEHAAVLCWHSSLHAGLFLAALAGAGVHVFRSVVWVKPVLIFGRHEYHWRHEPAFYGWFEGKRAAFHGPRSETTVWEVAASRSHGPDGGPSPGAIGRNLHPTQKPVELTTRPITNHTVVGEAVYDPFCGSGSAIIAAEQTGRIGFGVELDPRWVDVAVKRWEAFTGGTAVRV